jgi:hypothetical protein
LGALLEYFLGEGLKSWMRVGGLGKTQWATIILHLYAWTLEASPGLGLLSKGSAQSPCPHAARMTPSFSEPPRLSVLWPAISEPHPATTRVQVRLWALPDGGRAMSISVGPCAAPRPAERKGKTAKLSAFHGDSTEHQGWHEFVQWAFNFHLEYDLP